MADDDSQDDSQKTEDPTQKRLDDARKKGQVPSSKEVASFLSLFALTIIIATLLPFLFKQTFHNFGTFIHSPDAINLTPENIMPLVREVSKNLLLLIMIPAGISIIAIFINSAVQGNAVYSTDSIIPKLERISLLGGIKRMISLKSFVEFLKGIFKISIVGIIVSIAIYPELAKLDNLVASSIMAILLFLQSLALRVMIGICIAMAIIAVLDFAYQKFEYIKSLRMSRQDLKDEFKQTEGSPEVKAKLREIRNERAKNRTMQAVPEADVVLANPTHYSVALKYAPEERDAPFVIAKGKDLIALKMRDIAKEHDIPIIENPPLTRSIYKSVEVDQQIPMEHYNAIAEIIRYVYKLKGKTL